MPRAWGLFYLAVSLAWLFYLTWPVHAEPPTLPLPWTRLDEIYVTPSPVRMYTNNAVQVLTRLGDPLGPQEPNVWHTIDLTPFGVGVDATAAGLSGILIITHGYAVETAWLTLVFRRPGDAFNDCTKYIAQVIEPALQGGVRAPFSTMVPLRKGQLEFCYRIPEGMPAWPDASAYGFNLSVQWWGK